jgi:hypothetical protein
MRHVFFTALVAVCFAGAAPAEQSAPEYRLEFTRFQRMGDKIAGNIHWCLVTHQGV